MALTERIIQALLLMFELHREQTRKGSDIPYITHLMAVASMVGEYGGGEDQIIAALLHDAVEDQGGEATLEIIREQFGPDIAGLVLGLSDAVSRPKPPWRERKEHYIEAIAGESPELRLISACDKIHNARSITRDLRMYGPQVWERFAGKKEGTLWYYDAIREALSANWDHPVLEELDTVIQNLKKAAAEHQSPQ